MKRTSKVQNSMHIRAVRSIAFAVRCLDDIISLVDKTLTRFSHRIGGNHERSFI